MNSISSETRWVVRPRVRLLAQPIGLGIPLTLAGGFLSLNMLLAMNPEEHWILQLSTVLMGVGFFLIFLAGCNFLLSPFHKVWISRQEIQLRLGNMVLRQIPLSNVRSISATTREILVKNKDCDLYRLKINCNGSWPHNRSLWLDWSVATEQALKDTLTDVTFLF